MSARERLGLDLIVLTTVIIAANPAVTGIVLHEWVSIVLVVPAFIHLVSNWEWITRVAENLFRKLRAASLVNLAVDAGLFVSLVGVTLSGVLVLPGFSAATGLPADGVWHSVHLITSDLTLGFTAVHLALHARWIANVVRRMAAPVQPTPTPIAATRR